MSFCHTHCGRGTEVKYKQDLCITASLVFLFEYVFFCFVFAVLKSFLTKCLDFYITDSARDAEQEDAQDMYAECGPPLYHFGLQYWMANY